MWFSNWDYKFGFYCAENFHSRFTFHTIFFLSLKTVFFPGFVFVLFLNLYHFFLIQLTCDSANLLVVIRNNAIFPTFFEFSFFVYRLDSVYF